MYRIRNNLSRALTLSQSLPLSATGLASAPAVLCAVESTLWCGVALKQHSHMRVVLYVDPSGGHSKRDEWLMQLRACMPLAEIELWNDEQPGLNHCDYAVVWKASREVMTALYQQSSVKAVFNLGAGVDTVLVQGGSSLAERVPLIRIDDGGIKEQMADYVCAAILRYYRNLHTYSAHQQSSTWKSLPPVDKACFPVGIMGYGVLSRYEQPSPSITLNIPDRTSLPPHHLSRAVWLVSATSKVSSIH